MWRYVFMAFSFISFATYGPAMLQKKLGGSAQQASAPAEVAAAAAQPQPTKTDNPLDGRSTRIKADGSGHYVAKAKLNGRTADVLVDTGATRVAINESMARRIGIKLQKSDFKYKVNTANGQTMAAAIIIKQVEIGRVSASNVEATVLKDSALDGILLGMSFLGKLKRFEVAGGTLVLTQ